MSIAQRVINVLSKVQQEADQKNNAAIRNQNEVEKNGEENKINRQNISNEINNKDIFNLVLHEIGINSVSFVGAVVALEAEFGIEFPSEDLVYSKFNTVNDLIKYVKDKTGLED